MTKSRFALLFVRILLAGAAAHTEPSGTLEVQVLQGELSKLSASWVPSADQEGRWWWNPDRGGSAWIRLAGLQAGPLIPTSGTEGSRTWGPSVQAGSGHWGAAFDGEYGGFWGVQKPGTFEAGGQLRWKRDAWSAATGADRTWTLDGADGPRWSDQGRAGLSWADTGWTAGAEAEGSEADGGTLEYGGTARAGFDHGIFEGEVRGGWLSDAPWTMRLRGGLRGGANFLTAVWDRKEGSEYRAGLGFPLSGISWGVESGAKQSQNGWKFDGALSAEGKAGQWSASWALSEGSDALVQLLTTCWKQPTFQVEASWRVEGFQLGWFGPGARFGLTWRSLF